ncbi:hypothetical protein NDU88_005443 [Pleurodeles waltl]|uniref:Uncharacterized protein n=1 Tax=Pleurodeles waltl TaxID=8319 RepID=A0AAV7LCG9_PLEWA|nr:hypothetical protein NDU88_005443 [Pleurodeles waltl]
MHVLPHQPFRQGTLVAGSTEGLGTLLPGMLEDLGKDEAEEQSLGAVDPGKQRDWQHQWLRTLLPGVLEPGEGRGWEKQGLGSVGPGAPGSWDHKGTGDTTPWSTKARSTEDPEKDEAGRSKAWEQ